MATRAGTTEQEREQKFPPPLAQTREGTPGPSNSGPPLAISIDLEDYFHVEAFAGVVSRDNWSSYATRFEENTKRTLDLLSRFGTRATFFVLGWAAARAPRLIRKVAEAGHEIACHSYWHRRIWQITPEEFREDTRRAVKTLEDITGAKPRGYRAPTFSIDHRSLWAIDILAEEGFSYDSSVFPVRHDFYGMPSAPRTPFRWRSETGRTLVEVPMPTIRALGRSWAFGGGGYLRILPMAYNRWAIRKVTLEEKMPVVVYFHPWELDPDQPRLPGGLRSKLRHYTNLTGMESRLARLLQEHRFVTVQELIDGWTSKVALPEHQVNNHLSAEEVCLCHVP
jgi:polysaccharide deacetylase family protein (PEP-CTERM system associated)